MAMLAANHAESGVHPTPALLILDADLERGRRLARLLTLARLSTLLVASPLEAFRRLEATRITPAAILLGAVAAPQRLHLARLVERLAQRAGAEIPVAPLPFEAPEGGPLVASTSAPYFHVPEPGSERVLDLVQSVFPQRRAQFPLAGRSLALDLLPASGLTPRVSRLRRARNDYTLIMLDAAQQYVASPEWETLLGDVGLGFYQTPTGWPTDDRRHDVPVEYLSCLDCAVARSPSPDPADQRRLWGYTGMMTLLEGDHLPQLAKGAFKRADKEQPKMARFLRAFVSEMDAIRGELLHDWIHWPDGGYWLVHWSNLYAYGRVIDVNPDCHVWLGMLEAALRFHDLAGEWKPIEVECSCQTQTGHCIFALRPI